MEDFSKQVVDKIKSDKIKPKSKWQFLLKDYFVWLNFILAVFIGGLALVVVIHFFQANDWDIYKYLGASAIGHFFIALPLIWLLFLIFFLFIAYYNYRHTKTGYRYKTYWVIGGSLLGSIGLGVILSFFGLGDKIENLAAESVPYYQGFVHYKSEVWCHPEKGLLAGKIIEIKQDDRIILLDFRDNLWNVDTQKAVWRGMALKRVNQKIKVIGEEQGDDKFVAEEIRPWVGRRKHLERIEDEEYHHSDGRQCGRGSGCEMRHREMMYHREDE